jgi:long-chain acyl-CoA synthetase
MGADSSRPMLRTAGALVEMPGRNIAQLFLEAVDTHQKPDALKFKEGGTWRTISHQQVYEDVRRAALGLRALGVAPGDRVAILSENRPEWLISDFACVMSGAISVPLYAVLPADQIEYLLRDSEVKAIFVSTEEQLAKIREVRSRVPSLGRVISYDGPPGGESGVLPLAELLELGGTMLSDHPDDEYRERALATDPHDLLTIIYTSGTTGRPKGAMLTHNNVASNVHSVLQIFDIGPGDVALSVLPLCHIFERMAGHYVMFSAGVTIGYAESFAAVGDNFVEVRPTVMTLVPRGYEKIHARVAQAAREASPAKRRLLSWAIAVGARRLDRVMAGRKVGPLLAAEHKVADRLVFSKLREMTGGRLKFFVSGGAPLSPELARFFHSVGLPVLEGYGLTETSPAISFNRAEEVKPGSVGRPIPGVEVAIAEDGEILTRGPHVMKGYYKMPEATAAVMEPDGWFHTGDIGELDDEGRLSITDRKKDIIVTAGGKNIAPQPIENRAKSSPYVNEAVMIGDRRKFPVLLVVPDFDALESWARSERIGFSTHEALVADPRVAEFMEREVLATLSDLARFECPKRVALLSRELSIDSGEITPKLSVKRRVVETRYKEIIDSLYDVP